MPDANTFFPSGALYTWRESQGQQTTHQQQRTPRSQEKTPQYLSVVQWPPGAHPASGAVPTLGPYKLGCVTQRHDTHASRHQLSRARLCITKPKESKCFRA